MKNENKIGQFILMDQDFERMIDDLIPNLYARIVPLEVKYNYATAEFNVIAHSPEFDSVGLGESIPYYSLTINTKTKEYTFTKNGDTTGSVRRVLDKPNINQRLFPSYYKLKSWTYSSAIPAIVNALAKEIGSRAK